MVILRFIQIIEMLLLEPNRFTNSCGIIPNLFKIFSPWEIQMWRSVLHYSLSVSQMSLLVYISLKAGRLHCVTSVTAEHVLLLKHQSHHFGFTQKGDNLSNFIEKSFKIMFFAQQLSFVNLKMFDKEFT